MGETKFKAPPPNLDELLERQIPELTEEYMDRFIPHIFEILRGALKNAEYRKQIDAITRRRKRREAYAKKHGKTK